MEKQDDSKILICFSILGMIMSLMFLREECYWFGGIMIAISLSIILGLISRKLLFVKEVATENYINYN